MVNKKTKKQNDKKRLLRFTSSLKRRQRDIKTFTVSYGHLDDIILFIRTANKLKFYFYKIKWATH